MTNICSTIRNDVVMLKTLESQSTLLKLAYKKLKMHKDDGKHGFSSDRMLVILCLMFNSILTHGYTPDYCR